MKIQSLPPSVAALNPVLKPGKKEKKGAPKVRKGQSLQFTTHMQELQSLPVVNTQEIETIKKAIQEGKFQVNTNAIAEALIESARELISQR